MNVNWRACPTQHCIFKWPQLLCDEVEHVPDETSLADSSTALVLLSQQAWLADSTVLTHPSEVTAEYHNKRGTNPYSKVEIKSLPTH